MKIKARNILTNEVIFESENGAEVIQKAKESGLEFILDFSETTDENLQRTINKHFYRMVVCVRFCHAHTSIQSTKDNWQN